MNSRFRGVEVRPRPNEPIDKFIRRFTKKVRNDGILNEVFLRRSYEKPSVKRRRKAARARFIRKIEEHD